VTISGAPSAAEPAPGRTAALPLRDILAEFAVTTVLLFVVVAIVRWLVGAGSPLQIRDPHLALDVIGPLSGAVIALLIISPLGRLSGGHMNPAVTIALWLMDAFPGASVVPYVVAQLAGSAAGTALGRLAWGGVVSSHSVDFASIRPEAGWDGASVFLAEAGAMIVLTLVVGNFLAYPSVARWLPPTIGAAIAVLIVVLGPLSGGSANPARQFGPGLLAGADPVLAIYLCAPVVGAVLGAGLHHLLYRQLRIREPLTYRLDGRQVPTSTRSRSGA
jgi:glycerol uptake facilitator-like aquaporin